MSILFVATLAQAADISGYHEEPNKEFGKDSSYKLTGDAKFGWRTGTVAGDIDLNGHAFVMDTGGGNHTVFSGKNRWTRLVGNINAGVLPTKILSNTISRGRPLQFSAGR